MCSYSPATFHPLIHTNWNAFGNKIPKLKIPNLGNYHNSTKYRLDICEYCVKLLLANYNNGVEFATGWTGFLVQGKAAIDSFSQEVNLRYSVNTSARPSWAMDIEKLVTKLSILRSKNSKLARLIDAEFGSSSWFMQFKTFRDSEGVHRTRINRNLIVTIGVTVHRIQIQGLDVDTYSTRTILRINDALETGYCLM